MKGGDKVKEANVVKAFNPDKVKEERSTSEFGPARARGAHSNIINANKPHVYSFDEEEDLFSGSSFISRIIKIPLLDALKGDVKIAFDNESDQSRYDNYISDKKLDPFAVAEETLVEVRKHGTAIVYPYVKAIKGDIGKPLSGVTDILGFKVWHEGLIEKMKFDKDPFSLTFEEVNELKIKRNNEIVNVNPSRVFIVWNDDIKNLRDGEDEYRGISSINKLAQEITGYVTSKYSLTEIIHRLTFILFKMEQGAALDEAKKAEYKKELDILSQLFMGEKDSIEAVNSGNNVNPKIWIEGMLMPFSVATGIPVYRLLGSQEGALATSTENRLQYNALLESVIRKSLEKVIRYCVDLISIAISLGPYKVEWPDLNQLGEKDKMEVNKGKAETYETIGNAFKAFKEAKGVSGAQGVIEEIMKELDVGEGTVKAILGGGSNES